MSSPIPSRNSPSANRKSGFTRVLLAILIATIVLTPLAVGTIPFASAPFLAHEMVVAHALTLWLGAALLALILAAALCSGAINLRFHPALWALLLFVAWAGLSTAFAPDKIYAIFGYDNDYFCLLSIIALGIVAFVTVQLVDSLEKAKTIATAMVVSGTIAATVSLCEQLFSFSPVLSKMYPLWMISQGAGLQGNPDFTGSFLVLPALLAMAMFVTSEGTVRKTLYAVSATLCSVALVLTLTRSAWIGLAVGIIFMAYFALRSSRASWKAVVCGIAVILLTTSLSLVLFAETHIVANKFTTASSVLDLATESSRLDLITQSLKVITKNPLVGSGPANYIISWVGIQTPPAKAMNSGTVFGDPHSLPFFAPSTLGIVGGIAFLFFLLWSAAAAWRATSKKTSSKPLATAPPESVLPEALSPESAATEPDALAVDAPEIGSFATVSSESEPLEAQLIIAALAATLITSLAAATTISFVLYVVILASLLLAGAAKPMEAAILESQPTETPSVTTRPVESNELLTMVRPAATTIPSGTAGLASTTRPQACGLVFVSAAVLFVCAVGLLYGTVVKANLHYRVQQSFKGGTLTDTLQSASSTFPDEMKTAETAARIMVNDAYAGQKQIPDEVFAALSDMVQRHPSDPVIATTACAAYTIRGKQSGNNDDLQQAITLGTRVIKACPYNAQATLFLAMAHDAADNTQAAIKILQAYRQSMPENMHIEELYREATSQ